MTLTIKKQILIAGGDGLVGKRLVALLDKTKYHITILSRKSRSSEIPGVQYALWDTAQKTIDTIERPDFIINLAGAGIADKRWTNHRKEELIASRVDSAETLRRYLEANNIKPECYLSASAVGYYGDRKDEILDEMSGPGHEFMSDCCVQWENAARKTGKLCQRTVILRIGIVLSTLGGALPKMLMTESLSVFSYFGDGSQYYPWIHIDDLCRMMIAALEKDRFEGVYNAVAPQMVTNKQMMAEIMHTCGSGVLIPAPAFALKLSLGEMAKVVLNSNRVVSKRLSDTGFTFLFHQVGKAVSDLKSSNI